MLLTIGAVGTSTDWAVLVVNGIWSPTSSDADWLSTTTSDGVERILTSVTECKALKITRGSASIPNKKLKPGSTRLGMGLVSLFVLLTEPRSGLRPKFWLLR